MLNQSYKLKLMSEFSTTTMEMSDQLPKSSTRQDRQEARRAIVLTEAQMATGWFVILGLVALLGAIYLTQASRIASTGRRIQILQGELDDVERLNADLERDIAQAQSLERLQSEAIAQGFVTAAPEVIEYLVVPNYPAGATPTPTPSPTPVTPIETIGEALWVAFNNSIRHLIRGDSPR